MHSTISKYLRGLFAGVLIATFGCAHRGGDSAAKPEAASGLEPASPTADADGSDLSATPPVPPDVADAADAAVVSDQPANACEKECQRRRMAEAIGWDMIVHDCRKTCANSAEQPPAAP